MKLWIDAQLSPAIALWITENFALNATAVRDIGLREAEDEEIFFAARRDDAVVITKDSDFSLLLYRFGPPPRVIWLTCGNTSNARLKEILTKELARAVELLGSGEELVEITGL